MKKIVNFVFSLALLLFSGFNVFSQTCLPPTALTVSSITTNSATFGWTNASITDTKWQILLVPSEMAALPTIAPPANPSFVGQIMQTVEAPYTSPFQITGLEPAQIYFYYIRTICSESEVSEWSAPIYCNTTTCAALDKCNYKFLLTNANTNSWNGGRIQVLQNGILALTLGVVSINNTNGVTVPLCPNEPIQLFWSVAGTTPEDIGITIISPQNDIIYTKPAGVGTPLTMLYNQLGNCTPPTCPKPIPLAVNAVTIGTTSAQLTWTEQGTATQWEVFVTPFGSAPPVNGSPIIATSSAPTATNGGLYYLTETPLPFTVTGLTPATVYQYYVRALCLPSETSTWTILNPIKFVTKPLNDECVGAIEALVNPTMECNVSFNNLGNTLGATLSTPTIIGSGCGSTDDDVWFKFTAINNNHIINIDNIVSTPSGSSVTLNHMLLSGSCDNLVKLYCSTANQSVATNLIIGQTYYIRVYTNGSVVLNSASFNLCIKTAPAPATNDECTNSLTVVVNNYIDCLAITSGNLIGATASIEPLGTNPTSSPCFGSANDDVWFSFVATSGTEIVSLLNIEGTTTNLNHALYSGTFENLVRISCSPENLTESVNKNLVVGNTYYIRVWSNSINNQIVTFDVCVKALSSCQNADYFCGSTANDPHIYSNTVGIPDNTQIACLGSIPNPTFFTLKVEESGNLVYNILQNDSFDVVGNPIGQSLDVDFVAWGPFSSADSCDEISYTDCLTCPNNTLNPAFYPFGNIVDCSYDSSFTETLTINNAIVGQYYKVLITNFSNDIGYIRFLQTNFGEPNSGVTSCSDKLLLVAFVDTNNNGIKDSDEYNFQYGSFNYQKNNTGNTTIVTSPFGKHSIYDTDPTSLYDVSYEVFPEYLNYYSSGSTTFNDVSIPLNGGSQTLFFPITVLQTYTDLDVSLVSVTPAITGSNYISKIVYKNKGITPVSGTLSFTKDEAVTITEVSQSGTISNLTGFDYSFSNLMPNEKRTIFVTMSVPSIPVVNINDILNFSVSSTSIETDFDLTNNSFSNSQIVVASYDPNDKMESHGEKILFSDFDSSDYLNYTIRFENTGTSNAINVRIEDLLDSKLNESTIRVIDASHNYSMQRINNNITWTFENIQLQPTDINPSASKGYISFKVKPKPGYAIGDIIPNFANIYFDSNPAITTNTFTTEFVSTLANSSFDTSNFMIYPNPANEIIQVNLKNTNEKLESIQINDVLGKTIYKVDKLNTNSQSVEISNLSKGLYFVEITTQSKLKQTKKLTVE